MIILSETLPWTWSKPSLFFLRSTHSRRYFVNLNLKSYRRRDSNCREPGKGDEIENLVVVLSVSGPKYFFLDKLMYFVDYEILY